MPVFSYCNTKFVIIVCLILNSGALLMFTVSTNFYVLATSRLLVGFFQVTIVCDRCIYRYSVAYTSLYGLIYLVMRRGRLHG
jgi:uncharacterized membrane protein